MLEKNNLILSMKNIDKRFTGVHALKGVNFDLNEGEIHALVGENGAGKSTLMKALTGIYPKDSGEILYLGKAFIPGNPKEVLQAGIGIIHQELNMMDHLTVAQNIFIGREPTRLGGLFLDEDEQNKRTSELFARLNMDIDPLEMLGNLTVGKQQMVEIAKAVSHDLKILILDEPTAALTYISHRMDEINKITNRVTVLRDGEYVGTKKTAEVSKEDIINMMVGRVIYEEPKSKSNVLPHAETVLKVENLNAGRMVRDVSFSLKKGEILGFAGLMGAGRTETARAVFGADKIESGSIEVNGAIVKILSPMDAVSHGIGYLSEDRKRYGLATGLSVTDNAILASYDKFEHGIFIHKKNVEKVTAKYIEKLKVKTPSLNQILENLSGGNQQKVVISKWLIKNSEILIFDEPTRGIDVGAKSEIYTLMNELVKEGKSIIMISSELSEILRMSDRVVVMCEGRITGELKIEDASQEKIMKYATLRD